MADRDSASESDSSSIDGGPIMMPPSPVTREQLQKRIESLQQHNRVLKVELETYKLRVKALQEENRGLRQASVIIVRVDPFLFLTFLIAADVKYYALLLTIHKINLVETCRALYSRVKCSHLFIISKRKRMGSAQ